MSKDAMILRQQLRLLLTTAEIATAAVHQHTDRSSMSSGSSLTGKYEIMAGLTVRSISARPYNHHHQHQQHHHQQQQQQQQQTQHSSFIEQSASHTRLRSHRNRLSVHINMSLVVPGVSR